MRKIGEHCSNPGQWWLSRTLCPHLGGAGHFRLLLDAHMEVQGGQRHAQNRVCPLSITARSLCGGEGTAGTPLMGMVTGVPPHAGPALSSLQVGEQRGAMDKCLGNKAS